VRRHYAVAVALLVATRATAQEQDTDAATSAVFRRHAERVVKVQVVAKGSGARSTIGSGFFVTAAGHVVTNYHVVASVINLPGQYRAELVDPAGATTEVKVIAVDAVHDVAVLETGMAGRAHFTVAPLSLAQGTRLFSLGHPRDLALSIVEGTYNGFHPHTFYRRIHLTASLNPGMSGGPTIDRAGRVVGVNVSTQGNQVSFLVPVEHVIPLVARATGASGAAPSLYQVGRQLRAHQDAYLASMFDSTTRTIDLGPFRVVTQPASFFRCWGDTRRQRDLPYETSWHRCGTDDEIYLDEDQSTGTVFVRHQLVTTRTLNRSRFFALYSSIFGTDDSPSGSKDYVTNWSCTTRNVRSGTTPMRAAICLRRYHKLGELYDAFLKVAVLGPADVGLVSTLNLSGATYENVTQLVERYLDSIAWR
jgi:serine protease Do